MSNADITFYTGWLYLPWVIKPFWSPFVDHLRTKRFWVVAMQLVMGVGFAAIAGLTLSGYMHGHDLFLVDRFQLAHYDIAADGFYMLGLKEHQQSFFVGIRNTFFGVCINYGQGGWFSVVRYWQKTFTTSLGWCVVRVAGHCLLYRSYALYHRFVIQTPLPT